MATRRHIPFHGLGLLDIHDGVEEIRFSVLAAEILQLLLAHVCSSQLKDESSGVGRGANK